MQVDSYQYQLNYVEPVGFKKGELYVIDAKNCFLDGYGKPHDFTRLAVCIQGLINRNFKAHGTAIALNMDVTDDFWLDYITQDGCTYGGLKRVNIAGPEEMLSLFAPFLKEYGIIAWDPEVPSTANVASTICGLYNCVPVMESDKAGSLYAVLTQKYGIPVKKSLVGMFGNAKKGEKIVDTDLESTGSPKNDAYLWAIEKYMDRCNPECLAYTLDGASSVETNPVFKVRDSYSAQITGIPNHDYFVYKQCFFFDLTSYGLEAPSDEPNQPLGADAATTVKILKKRYDMANGRFGEVLGFPPWHVKYTTHVGDYDLLPPRLEWHFVETCSSYNCGIEADAANPAWMSNGSLYTNYERRFEPKGNALPKDMEYDPDTHYFTVCYTGDFDCSPWMKWRVPTVWRDENRGTIPMAYNYGINLIERIPMAFDYVYEHQTKNDYLTAGEGMGYVVVDALFKGFIGKEANPDYAYWTRYSRETGCPVERIMPDGDEHYYAYAKPYYENSKLDISGKLINCFTPASPRSLKLYNRLSPRGGFMCNITAGKYDFQTCDGVPYFRVTGIFGDTDEAKAAHLFLKINSRDTNFLAAGFNDRGVNYASPSGVKAFVEAFKKLAAEKDPEGKYEYVDIVTFFDLARKSGLGTEVGRD